MAVSLQGVEWEGIHSERAEIDSPDGVEAPYLPPGISVNEAVTVAFDPLPPPAPRPGVAPRLPLVRLALAFYGVLLGAALAWAWLTGRSLLWASEAAAERGASPLVDFGAGLLAAAIVVLLSRQLTERTRVGEQLARSLRAALGPLSLAECWLLALLSGVAEEAFFRGALQPRVGLLAASLLFGAAHFVPRRELLPWTAFSIAAGLLLGWLFDATGNLIAPIVAHAGINGVNLRHLTRGEGDVGLEV
jgi:membrane protease YdiL (CAAX protease family)